MKIRIILAALCVLPFTALHAADSSNGEIMTIGKDRFKGPETVIWDEKADIYLVSNVNGKLTGRDDNGFISKVSPDGKIQQLKWIDGASGPDVMLHAPKDMILTDKYLVVADLGAVRYFDRDSGKPVRSEVIPDSHMLNALTYDAEGKVLYVTDTGGKTDEKPGAVYRIAPGEKPKKIASGPKLDRPNGIAWEDNALLVAPFGQHADHLYRLTTSGERKPETKLPKAQLDGLVRLDDGSKLVTSWKGKAVYHVMPDGRVETVAEGISQPAQIGYDAKRKRVLIPAAKDNKVVVYELSGS